MKKRQISISTCFNYEIPIEEQLKLISAQGFNHISIGGNIEHSDIFNEIGKEKLKTLLENYSLEVDTVHGCRIDLQDSFEKLSLTAKVASELEAQTVVFHCSQFYIEKSDIDEKVKRALEVCEMLEKSAQKYNIKFALENLHPEAATDVVKIVLPKLNRKYFGLCYDSSHDQVDGPRPFDLLEVFKDRLFAIHISDRIKEFVDHVIPGEGFIDFDSICNILKGSDYNKPLLLELMTLHSKEKEPRRFLEQAYYSGVGLYDKIYY